MTNEVEDIDHGFDAMMDMLEELDGENYVEVGVPEGSGQYDDGANQVTVATANEFGATIEHPNGATITIPERSFIRSTMDDKDRRFTALLSKFIGEIIDGDMTPDDAMEGLGLDAVAQVKRKIDDLKEPPNAESTIRQKRGSSNPLVDTGNLKQSITHRVNGEDT